MLTTNRLDVVGSFLVARNTSSLEESMGVGTLIHFLACHSLNIMLNSIEGHAIGDTPTRAFAFGFLSSQWDSKVSWEEPHFFG